MESTPDVDQSRRTNKLSQTNTLKILVFPYTDLLGTTFIQDNHKCLDLTLQDS